MGRANLVFICLWLLCLYAEGLKKKSGKKPTTSTSMCKKTDIDQMSGSFSSLLRNEVADLRNDMTGLQGDVGDKLNDVQNKLSQMHDANMDVRDDLFELKEKISALTHGGRQENMTLPELVAVHDCQSIPQYIGVANIKTSSGKKFKAFCNKGWLSIARRFDGSQKFQKIWMEYKNGFGDPAGENFIGFDNLRAVLAQRKYQLKIELGDWDGGEIYAMYDVFDVGTEAEKYNLTIGNYSGNAGDAMPHHNERKFSTVDQDNDDHTTHCANTYKGGWWYGSCHNANLFGRYSQSPACSAHAQCIVWDSKDNFSYKAIDMRIYPL